MILCDMDGVLATGPRGDTTCGEPIYRTFMDITDELERIRAAGVPIHVVTAKVEAEAAQVLQAIGLEDHVASVVGADRLFWPSLWAAARARRLPNALSKSLCRRLLPRGQEERAVMIENHHPHLREMLAARAIDLGILVPPIAMEGNRITTWFDLNLALRIAREFATGTLDSEDLSGRGVQLYAWNGDRPERLDPSRLPSITLGGQHLIHLPGLSVEDSPAVEALHTGSILRPGGANVVTTVRAGRRFLKRFVQRFSPS